MFLERKKAKQLSKQEAKSGAQVHSYDFVVDILASFLSVAVINSSHTHTHTFNGPYNHASTPTLSFYRPDALPATQPTASKHLSGCDKQFIAVNV